jgi:hypothetical protein
MNISRKCGPSGASFLLSPLRGLYDALSPFGRAFLVPRPLDAVDDFDPNFSRKRQAENDNTIQTLGGLVVRKTQ